MCIMYYVIPALHAPIYQLANTVFLYSTNSSTDKQAFNKNGLILNWYLNMLLYPDGK